MDDEENELRNPFPSPPSHYTRYTSHNLKLLALLRERASSKGVEPEAHNQHELLSDQKDVPEWPLVQLEKPRVDWILEDPEGYYDVYGDRWFVKEKIPSLAELGGTQLYPSDPSVDRRPALLSVLKSLLVTYSNLITSLLRPPPVAPGARCNLELMMQRQLELRREETKNIHSKCDELESKLRELRSSALELSVKSNPTSISTSPISPSENDSTSPSVAQIAVVSLGVIPPSHIDVVLEQCAKILFEVLKAFERLLFTQAMSYAPVEHYYVIVPSAFRMNFKSTPHVRSSTALMSTRRRIGVSAATTEAARRQLMQPVPCWEQAWVPSEVNPNLKVYKWIKTDKVQHFSDEEAEDEPLAPLPDEPEIVEGDDDMDQDETQAPSRAEPATKEGTEVEAGTETGAEDSKAPSPKPEPLALDREETQQPDDDAAEGEEKEPETMQLDMSSIGPDGLPLDGNDLSQLTPSDGLVGGVAMDQSVDPFADTT
ncbi:hypothetical protein NMY22_g8617 [Coprinellus aureogranulatus]|nr:hypothetical protein NMY22_g8617 [Coprinellus aureogranulatus]